MFVDPGGTTLWYGAQDGLIRYTPGARSAGTIPSTLIHQVRTLRSDSLLDVRSERALELDYAYNGVQISYGAPSLIRPSAVEYQYRHGEDEWSAWTERTTRELPNLSAGRHVFSVRARTAYGDTTQAARYAFVVHPPWYRTGWAYAGYALLLLGLIAGSVQWRTRRLRRQQRQLEQIVKKRTATIRERNEQLAQQADKLKELDEAKSRFFANFSHEFRTPLTLIRGPVRTVREHLEQGAMDREADAEQLAIAERNTARLQRLIDQILGLARLDANTYEIAARPTDLNAEAQRIARAFQPLAERNGLTLTAHTNGSSAEQPGEHPGDPDVPPVYVDRRWSTS